MSPERPGPAGVPASALPVVAGWLAVALGAGLRLAWSLELPWLATEATEGLVTRRSSSLLLLLAGGALVLLAQPAAPRWRRRMGGALALALAVLGALVLASPAAGWQRALDRPAPVEAPTISALLEPGGVAPVSALAFLSLGLALLALDWTPRPRLRPAEPLATLPLGLGLFWLGAALVRRPALEDPSRAPAPALLTALLLVLLATGVLAARRGSGLLGTLGSGRPGPRGLAVLAATIGLLLIGGGLLHALQGQQAVADAASEVESVGTLKAEQLLTWRTERLHDAQQAVGRPALVELLRRWSADPVEHPGAEARIRSELEPTLAIGEYTDILLLDAEGSPHLDLSGDRPEEGEALRAAVQRARASGRAELGELAGLGPRHRPMLDVVAPVLGPGPGSAPLGFVVLRIDPAAGLFKIARGWPTPARTGEVVLARREGDRVRFLNPLRAPAERPLELTLPLSQRALPSAQGLGGRVGAALVGRDYRGAPVLASVQPVPGTAWFLVAKLDLEEVAERWSSRRLLLAAVVTLLSLLLLVALAFASLQRLRLRELEDAHRQLGEQEQRLATAFRRSPLPEAIATLDGVFREVNEAFLRNNGYTREEVVGRSALELGMWPDPVERQALVADLRAGGEVAERPVTVRVKDGRLRSSLFWARLIDLGGVPHLYSILLDVTERRALDAALRQGEDRYKQAMELTGTGYVEVDHEGRVLEANRVYLSMAGVERLEAIRGRSVVEWTAPEAQASNAAAVAQAAREGGIHDFETVYLRPDGSRLGLSINAIAEQGPLGPRLVALCRDISGRMRLEAEQRALVEQLRRSNAELEQFAFVASHDLQEPLRKIQAFGEVLKEDLVQAGALSEQVEASVSRMQGGARRMNLLINNLLEYSRVSTRGVPFEPTDLEGAVRAAAEDFAERLADAGARLEVAELPRVEADPNQMAQLFGNLLGNAFKYRRKDVPLRVEVTGAVVDGRCRVEVRDNGIGFEPQYAERIFGIFQRLHGRQEYEGTGIGLAICRKIAERHRGTLVAEGRPGEGATFILTLPLTQPGGDAAGGARATGAAAEAQAAGS